MTTSKEINQISMPKNDVTRLIRVIVILCIATVIAMITSVMAIYTASGNKTISVAVDYKGAVIPVISLSDPLMSESRVLAFVDECLRKSFSHDFLHFDQTIPQAQDCFTPNSADKFVISLQPYVKIMEEKRMVMSVTVPRPPRVVNVYTINTLTGPVVHWDVQAQIEIFFEGRNERIPSSKSTVQITVKRVPLEGTPRGILIDKFSVGVGQ